MTTRMIVSAVGILIALAVAAIALLVANEDRFLYFPQKALDGRPEDYGLRAEELTLASEGGARLSGWWVHGTGRAVLLFFHGNAGNISHRLERTRSLVETLGLDVVLVDYRGYGRSGGKPSEQGLYADGEAIYRAAAGRGIPPGRIVLFGESLGCAVAIETALRRPCRALILEAPFASVPAMAKTAFPFLPAFLVRAKFDNMDKIRRVAVPKLVVQAERDEVVPPAQTRELFEVAAPPKQYYLVRAAQHNDASVVGGRAYLETLRRFLEASGLTETGGR